MGTSCSNRFASPARPATTSTRGAWRCEPQPTFSGTDLARVLVELGRLHNPFGQWALSEETLAGAVLVADALADDDTADMQARALAHWGFAQALLSRYEAAELTLNRAQGLDTSPLVTCEVLFASASLDCELGRLVAALEPAFPLTSVHEVLRAWRGDGPDSLVSLEVAGDDTSRLLVFSSAGCPCES